jgi:ribosomal protein S6--L-glutamate ligase
MRLWVLSQLVGSPGTQRFLDAAIARGHAARLLHPLDPDLALGQRGGLRLAGEAVELPDLAFTRMGAASPAAGLNLLLQLEALGVPVVNSPLALWQSRDKVRSLVLLARAGLPVPASLVPGRTTRPAEIEAALGPPPWVLKRPEGAKGDGVSLVHSAEQLAGCGGAHTTPDEPHLVQRFVAESSGVDLRVLVVGGQVLGAMRRRSATGDFRSNLHQGGLGEPAEPTPEVAELALHAAATLGLEVAGVDLLEAREGPLLLEVNGSPGLAGIEDATGLPLAAGVVAFLERRLLEA